MSSVLQHLYNHADCLVSQKKKIYTMNESTGVVISGDTYFPFSKTGRIMLIIFILYIGYITVQSVSE